MPYTIEKLKNADKSETDSFSLDLELFVSTSTSYVDIDMNKVREDNDVDSDTEEQKVGLDGEAKRIVKLLETKYAEKGIKTNTKYFSKADMVKKDVGYDNEDDFIDDGEQFDELIPYNFDTPLGGYYINEGSVTLKELFEIEEPGDLSDDAESEDEEMEVNVAQAIGDTIETDGHVESDGSKITKDSVENNDAATSMAKKRKLDNNIPPEAKKMKVNGHGGPPEHHVPTGIENGSSPKQSQKDGSFNGTISEKASMLIENLLQLIAVDKNPNKKFRISTSMISLVDQILRCVESENMSSRDISKIVQEIANRMGIHKSSIQAKLKQYRDTTEAGCSSQNSNGSSGERTNITSNITSGESGERPSTTNGSNNKKYDEVVEMANKSLDAAAFEIISKYPPSDEPFKLRNYMLTVRNQISKEFLNNINNDLLACVKINSAGKKHVVWSKALETKFKEVFMICFSAVKTDPLVTDEKYPDCFNRSLQASLTQLFVLNGIAIEIFQTKMLEIISSNTAITAEINAAISAQEKAQKEIKEQKEFENKKIAEMEAQNVAYHKKMQDEEIKRKNAVDEKKRRDSEDRKKMQHQYELTNKLKQQKAAEAEALIKFAAARNAMEIQQKVKLQSELFNKTPSKTQASSLNGSFSNYGESSSQKTPTSKNKESPVNNMAGSSNSNAKTFNNTQMNPELLANLMRQYNISANSKNFKEILDKFQPPNVQNQLMSQNALQLIAAAYKQQQQQQLQNLDQTQILKFCQNKGLVNDEILQILQLQSKDLTLINSAVTTLLNNRKTQ
uniref:HUN domain-containing protein n=1 Tax=Rhabditophanes sp. KR3021 TaxID=114890 RepID=A0AC35TKA6_9BILA